MSGENEPVFVTMDKHGAEEMRKMIAEGGVVTLTPDMMRDLFENMRKRRDNWERISKALVAGVDDTTKLAIACWAVGCIVKNSREGGSFRGLIYETMGFGPEAYMPMYEAGGMEITNHLELVGKPTPQEEAAKALEKIVETAEGGGA